MFEHQSLSIDVHTADCLEKARILRGRKTWSPRTWGIMIGALLVFLFIMIGPR